MTRPTRATIRVTRHFTVSAERVYDAWLDAKVAARWLFATPTGQMVRAETDPRVGGTFVFVDRRDGQDEEHVGEYLELDRPRRIVFTFAVPRHSKEYTTVTVDIVPNGGGCDLTLTHDGVLPDFESRTVQGWTRMLEGLATAVV
jgi:uncharacterized protein YndB with AHSA1/START domain